MQYFLIFFFFLAFLGKYLSCIYNGYILSTFWQNSFTTCLQVLVDVLIYFCMLQEFIELNFDIFISKQFTDNLSQLNYPLLIELYHLNSMIICTRYFIMCLFCKLFFSRKSIYHQGIGQIEHAIYRLTYCNNLYPCDEQFQKLG